MAYELSDPALRIYMQDISKTPLLTPEDEIALAERIKDGDESAREQMIKANLRLVVKIAQDYANYGVPVLDLISEGNIGLMKAVEKFDPNKGGKLSTYASWWIKQSIKRALANQGKTVRLPVHMVDKVAKMRRIETQLATELGRAPTDEEIGEEIGIPRNKIAMLRQASQRPESLDAPMQEGETTTYGEIIADSHAVDPSDMLSDKNMHGELSGLLGILKPREREIIEKRFGLNGYEKELTLEEVGAELGVTRERIRQLQNTAIGKMQRALQRKEKLSLSHPKQEKILKRVQESVEILLLQPRRQEVWNMLKNSDISVEQKEKNLRSMIIEKDVTWYSLSRSALEQLRKIKVHDDSHKEVTFADVETFLRGTVFARNT